MKSLVSYVSKVLADAQTWCRVSTHRDLRTITDRVEHEGLSFLTITLPSFGQSFEQAIEHGSICSSSFPGFALDRRGFPRFLGGLLCRVFDSGTGRLLDEPSADAIFFVRQVCYLFKKLELDCSPSRKRKAIEAYVQCDTEVGEWHDNVDSRLIDDFRTAAGLLFGTSLAALGRKVRELQHVPKHGPGATAEKLSANGRFTQREWTDRLQADFPFDLFGIPSWNFVEHIGEVDFREPGRERPSRVVLVPKTLKTPRVIAIEPACMQYAQQSLLEILVPELESTKYSGALGFTDQTINQRLACEASLDLSCSTLDLSEASDRVSNQLALALLSSDPTFSGAVQACRSTRADVFGQVVNLNKFASMGSALCFPIEAMVFLTILRLADCKRLGVLPGSRKGLRVFLRSVRVYGDDIIIPVDLTQLALQHLEAYGLKVNKHKSFWKSNFRESCGGDYFNGVPVKPVYLRELPEMATPQSKRASLVSLISSRNQLYKLGLWETCKFLDEKIGTLVPFPIVEDTSPISGRSSFLPWEGLRDCPTLHRPLVKGLILRPRPPVDELDGFGALLKFFLKRGDEPRDRNHLLKYGRPRSADTKIAWSTPY